MKKTSALIALLLIAAMVLSACGQASSNAGAAPAAAQPAAEQPAAAPAETKSEPTYVLKLGHEGKGDAHPYQYGSLKFAELVSEKTNGDVKIEVYGGGTLGTQKELVEMVYLGTLDFAECIQSVLESYDSRYGSIALPFLYKDLDQYWAVFDGEVGAEIKGWLKGSGMTFLSMWQNGVFQIQSNFPCHVPGDLQGKKMRLAEGQVSNALADSLGVVMATLTLSEMYQALQMKTIDCLPTQITNSYNVEAHKHSPYFCFNSFMINGEALVMNSAKLASLPPEYQTAIQEAADEAAILQREYAESLVAEQVAAMEKEGMIRYDPTEEEMQLWRDVCAAPVYEKFPEWADIVAKIQAVSAA